MENVNLKEFVIKFGLLLGVVEIAIILITYLFGVEYMASNWISLLTLVIIIFIVVYAGKEWKKQLNGFISFKAAFLVMFLVYALGGFITLLFNITLFNVIDPGLAIEVQEAVIDNTMSMLENFGAPEEIMEQQLRELEDLSERFTPLAMLKGFIWTLLLGAIIAAIAGAVIKNEKPEFEENE